MPYQRPWKSYEEQLVLLESRGLLISDRVKAIEYLERIGYYRLSGYWYPFRERFAYCPLELSKGKKNKQGKVEWLLEDNFKPNTSFQSAVELYVFDKNLRLLAMDALERVEIALRVDIAHSLGKNNAFAYLQADLFHETFAEKLQADTGLTKHHKWLTGHAALIARSKEEFVRHYRERHGLPLPIWVACELWDFGTLSTLFSGMKEIDQDEVSQKYGLKNGRIFSSWLRSLNYLRNICAHHSRLWNRNIVDQPQLTHRGEIPIIDLFSAKTQSRCFLLLVITRHLLLTINPSSTWWQRLKNHLESFPKIEYVDLTDMGIIEEWKEW